MFDDTDKILGSIGLEDLSDEEKEGLIQKAIDDFENIEGVSFKDQSEMDDKQILEDDFKTSKSVLQKNINRVEKVTNLLMDQLAIQPENVMLISNLTSVISEQNKQIKLVLELDNKNLNNKQLADKVVPKESKKDPLKRFSSAK